MAERINRWENFGMKKGKELEYSLLKSIKNSPYFFQYKEDLDSLVQKYSEKKQRVPLEEAMGLVKKYQPAGWDAVNPPKQLLKDLKLEVGELLHLSDADMDKVKTYTAVDSVLDSNFGVDAFLTLENKGKEYFVTYDLTRNPDKERGKHQNTILITDLAEPPEPGEKVSPEQENTYLASVEKIAKLTVDQLRSLEI